MDDTASSTLPEPSTSTPEPPKTPPFTAIARTEEIPWSPPPPTTNTCTSCEDPIPTPTTWETSFQAPCSHWYCIACLSQLFSASLVDETLYPPKCCEPLPWYDVVPRLSDDLAAAFVQKMDELDTPAPERVYCARPACSLFLGSDKALPGGIVGCDVCDHYTCTTCRAASHAEPCSREQGLQLQQEDEAMQEILRLAGEKGWQTCRQCSRVIDLIPGGCNHMTCVCGYQFCYACGERWRDCNCPPRLLRFGN